MTVVVGVLVTHDQAVQGVSEHWFSVSACTNDFVINTHFDIECRESCIHYCLQKPHTHSMAHIESHT